MRKTIILAAAVLAMAFSSIASTAQTVNNFTIKRGTNISHWLSQTPERGEARRQHIKEEDFARLEELGFDFVRIPIDEEQFWDEQGNKLPEAWQLLTQALNWAGKHHLRTIVDMHIIRSHDFNAVNEGRTNVLFTSDKAQQDLINMWYQLSDALKAYSVDSVAYELMNEPVADEHEQWNKLISRHIKLSESVSRSARWSSAQTCGRPRGHSSTCAYPRETRTSFSRSIIMSRRHLHTMARPGRR